MGSILKKIIQKTKADSRFKELLEKEFELNFIGFISDRQAKEREKQILELSKDLQNLIKDAN